MKISLNTLRYYRDKYDWAGDPAPDGVDTLIHRISSQLGGVEDTIAFGKKYDGVVIVKVVSCEDHPNADRLHVVMVDDGGITPDVPRNGNGHVQVVCGAPNVRAGVTVAWLPPGATVPSTYNDDPFVLEGRQLRGVVSNGMLASPKELAIGDSHEGLLIIEEEVAPGTMFADEYGLRGDIVIDIENKMFTHRPDCFGWMGVAREIAGIQGQPFKSPDWYQEDAELPKPENVTLPLEVRNEIPELVPRFTAIAVEGIEIGPSPVWLQVELAKVGLRPINNIVDLTNYYMLFTGQPLHAYDYDKVKALDGGDKATIVVRKPHGGEKLTLLNGKEVEPRKDAILIATESQAIGLGGVMGGDNTEVDENTKNIILECATFDMYSIRKTSMANGVFTDAVTRFSKGQSPLQNRAVLARITKDILRICKGGIASYPVDCNDTDTEIIESKHEPLNIGVGFVNDRLGVKFETDEIIRLLENVEFDAHETTPDEVCVTAPFWRTDIEIPEDVVEEVGRLYGFDKLPLQLPLGPITPAVKNHMFETHGAIRERLSAAGANEVLTYSFVHGNLLANAGQDAAEAYKLSNALSPDLQYFRLSLTPSLLATVNQNVRTGYDKFTLFEIGKVHGTSELQEGLPRELGRLGLVYADASRHDGAAYYQARNYLETLLPQQGVVTYKPLRDFDAGEHKMFAQLAAPFQPKRAAVVFDGDMLIGIVGEYKTSVLKAFKLPEQCAGFEIFLSYLDKTIGAMRSYVPLPKFPKVTQDISLKVAASAAYAAVYDAVWNGVNESGRSDKTDILVTLSPLDIYQREDDGDHKQVTLRLSVQSYEKTLTDAEVAAMLDAAARRAAELMGAERL